MSINTTVPLASEKPNYSISKRARIGKENRKTTRKPLKHSPLRDDNSYNNVSSDIPANFPSVPWGMTSFHIAATTPKGATVDQALKNIQRIHNAGVGKRSKPRFASGI